MANPKAIVAAIILIALLVGTVGFSILTFDHPLFPLVGSANAALGVGPVGPMGPQGPKGDTGATGAIGPQGPQGIQGVAGTNGTNGSNGATGATGPQGPQGIQGVAGTNGTNGSNGATGATGPQGPAGMNGNVSITITTTVSVTAGQVLFQNSSGYYLAKSLTSATLPTQGIFGIAMQTVSSGNPCIVVTSGSLTIATYSLTTGAAYYVSNSTAGALMLGSPLGTGQQSQLIGQATNATTILLNPKNVIGQ